MIVYKIVEVKNGDYYSLFHGTKGSRKLPINQWIEADQKYVRDGSGETFYNSGFHVLLTKGGAEKFFETKFKKKENRIVVACEVHSADLRPKEHSKSEIYLVDRMRVIGAV